MSKVNLLQAGTVGVDMKTNPLFLTNGKLHSATNIVFEEAVIRTRPGFRYSYLGIAGKFQGAAFFRPRHGLSSKALSEAADSLAVVVDGEAWLGCNKVGGEFACGEAVNIFPAENYLVFQNPNSNTYWWDGFTLTESPGLNEEHWDEIETPLAEIEHETPVADIPECGGESPEASFTLTITVVDAASNPVEGALVVLKTNGTRAYQGISDALGKIILNPTPRLYTCDVSKDGYDALFDQDLVVSGEATEYQYDDCVEPVILVGGDLSITFVMGTGEGTGCLGCDGVGFPAPPGDGDPGICPNNICSRVTFVEKLEAEVGDGTLFPLQVTQEQMVAIMYRVRDAKFTSGEITQLDIPSEGGFTTTTKFTFSFQDPPPEFCDSVSDGFTVRSYCTFAEGLVSPAVPMPEYTEPIFGDAYYFTDAYNPNGAGSGSIGVRDAVSELAVCAEVTRPNPHDEFAADVTGYDISGAASLQFFDLAVISAFVGGGEFRTGFTQHAAWNYFGATHPHLTKYLPIAKAENFAEEGDVEYGYAEMQLIFSGLVAFVDDDGSGDPTSPGNRMFIGLEFDGTSDISPLGNHYTTREKANTVGANLVFNFGGSGIPEASCPLYGLLEVTGSATDLVISATKWWEYPTCASGSFDPDTGLPL